MGKYSGYLILSDIDGTLTNHTGQVSQENLDAIREFQAEGGRFTIATGRMPDYIQALPFQINAPICAINGTILCSPEGETISDFPMDTHYEEVIRYVVAHYPTFHLIRRHHADNYVSWSRDTHGQDQLDILLHGDACYKFVMEGTTEPETTAAMRDLIARYGEWFELDRSWPTGLELHQKGSGKGVCLRIMRTLLPDVHTCIAVGDYENDLSMMQEADIGCAVANAIPAVKAAADRTIVSNEEHAIAHIVHTLIPELKHGIV